MKKYSRQELETEKATLDVVRRTVEASRPFVTPRLRPAAFGLFGAVVALFVIWMVCDYIWHVRPPEYVCLPLLGYMMYVCLAVGDGKAQLRNAWLKQASVYPRLRKSVARWGELEDLRTAYVKDWSPEEIESEQSILREQIGVLWVIAHIEAGLVLTETEEEQIEQEKMQDLLHKVHSEQAKMEAAKRQREDNANFLSACTEAGYGDLAVMVQSHEEAVAELVEIRLGEGVE